MGSIKIQKQDRQTRLNELVETHNLALSFQRLQGAPYDHRRWKRALYHALGLSGCVDSDELRSIREALKLP